MLNKIELKETSECFFTPYYFFKNDKMFNFCVGSRGTGKTTNWLTYLIRDASIKQKQVALVLRWQRNIDEYRANPTAFTNIEKLYNKWYGERIILTQKKETVYMITNLREDEDGKYRPWSEYDYEKDKLVEYNVSTPVMQFFALSKYNEYKSKDWSDIIYIFMDEFQCEEKTASVGYLNKEPEKLINIVDTIAREFGNQYRDVRVILCSNAVDLYNPYYLYFGLINDIDRTAKSQRICKKHIAYELHYIEIDKGEFGEFISNTDYGAYAKDNVYRKEQRHDILDKINPSILTKWFCIRHRDYYITFYLFHFAKEKAIYCKRTIGKDTTELKVPQARIELSSVRKGFMDMYFDGYMTKSVLCGLGLADWGY